MKPKHISYLVVVVILVCFTVLYKTRFTTSNQIKDFSSNELRVQTASLLSFHNLSKFEFVSNDGQFNPQIHFYTLSAGHAILFCSDAVTFRKTIRNTSGKKKIRLSEFTLRFVGASDKAFIEGISKTRNSSNYYLGNDSKKWKNNVPGYHAIEYHNLYDGIDLHYGSSRNKLKSTFYLEAGRSPDAIKLQYLGTGTLRITRDGSLEVKTTLGKIIDSPPVVYQTDKHNLQIPRKARYKLFDKTTYGFEIADLDPALPLVIDPEIAYSGTYGGTKSDQVADMVFGNDGMLYIAGRTFSADFPTTAGAPYPDEPGGPSYLPQDAYVLKLNPTTGEILYATYIGGTNNSETAYGIAVDDSGNVYVSGETTSDDFPLVNAVQNSLQGYDDAFMVKINNMGEVKASTYYGGSSGDLGYDIAVDNEYNIWMVGTSSDVPAVNALQTAGGSNDGFIVEFSNDGGTLLFSTPYGGSGYDEFYGIVSDPHGYLYIIGDAYSSNFPVNNATQGTLKGTTDAVVVKLKASDKNVPFATFYGGSDFETGKDIAVDSNENIFALGSTGSDDLPLSNETQSVRGGGNDIYISGWYYDSGSGIYSNDFSTYLGGSDEDNPRKIALNITKVSSGSIAMKFDKNDSNGLKTETTMNYSGDTDVVSMVIAAQSSSFDFPKSDTFPEPFTSLPAGCITQYSGVSNPFSGITKDYSSIIYSLTSCDAVATGGGSTYVAGSTKDTNNVRYDVITSVAPNLSIKKSVDNDTALYHDTLTFCITVSNKGNAPAENIVIKDIIYKSCYTFLDVVDMENYLSGSITIDTTSDGIELTYNAGTLGTDLLDNKDFICYRVIVNTFGDGVCDNTATAKGDNTPLYSDKAFVFLGTLSADIAKRCNIDTAYVSDVVKYTIKVTNTGYLPIEYPYIHETYTDDEQELLKVEGALRTEKAPIGGIGKLLYINTLQPGQSDSVMMTFRIKSYNKKSPKILDGAFFKDSKRRDIKSTLFFLPIGKFKINQSLLYYTNSTPVSQEKSTFVNYSDAILSSDNYHIFIDSVESGVTPGADTGATITDFELASVSPYIHIVPEGESIQDAIFAKQFNFYTGNPDDSTFHLPTAYQLLIPDYTDSAVVILKRDWRQTAQDNSKVDFYIAHTVNNEETYNINLAGTNTDVATGLQFGQVSDYTSVAPGTYTLEIRNTNGDLVASSDLDLSNDAGRSLTLILAPTDSTSSNGMGIKIFGASAVDSIWTLEGESVISSIDHVISAQEISLSYRNTNPVMIDFTLPEAGRATLRVYDLNGREITTLANRFYNPGSYSVPFTTNGLPSGIYIYKLTINRMQKTNKMMVGQQRIDL